MEKEFQELKNLLDSIVVAAKLLGYHVVHENGKFYFYEHKKIMPYIEIELILWNNHKNTIFTSMESFAHQILDKQSHEVKVNHLNNLLNKL